MRVENAEDAVLTVLAAFSGIARAQAANSKTLRRSRSLPAVLDDMRGVGPVPADCQAGPNRNLSRPSVDAAVSRWRRMGSAVAARSRGRNWLRITAKDIRRFDADNATFALAPLIILWQVSQLGGNGGFCVFRFWAFRSCYVARLGISQFREAKSANAVQTHKLAMDSAIMAWLSSMRPENSFM